MNTTEEAPIEKLDYPKDIPYGHYSENGVIAAYPDYGTLGKKKINFKMVMKILHRLDGMDEQTDEQLFYYIYKMGNDFAKQIEQEVRIEYTDALKFLKGFYLISGDGLIWYHNSGVHGLPGMTFQNGRVNPK